MSTDEYVPSIDDVANAWSCAAQYLRGIAPDDGSDVAEFDRFLARVRRDAGRSGYYHGYNDRRLERDYNHAYPEETP